MTPKDAASILPRKTVEGELTAVDDNGSFTLYALVFGNVDRQGDLIEPKAVTNVPEFVKDGWIALNHDATAKPTALIDSAIQDDHGLKVTGRFHSHPDAQHVRSYVKERLDAGKAVKTSIGYLVPADGERYEKQNGRMVRHITKLSVYEASFVNLPANPEAEVVSAKSISELPEDHDMAAEQGLLEALKVALGLQTKAGRKMSAANIEKCKGYVEKCMSNVKAMKAVHDDHKAMTEEFSKFVKAFEGGKLAEDPEGDEEIEGDDGKKMARPEDTADGDPPKKKPKAKVVDESDEEDDGSDVKPPKGKGKDAGSKAESEALEAYRNQLRRRALNDRFSTLISQGGTNGD